MKIVIKVKQCQILDVIIFLKLPMNIVASVEGIATEAIVGNNEIVEYGQTLFKIKKYGLIIYI